ncbi:hypothetical protein Leryth_027706 [Lithospermum erythrorhizon]|nr:hypothetical protein Leryth_027706 [Lithospermum erythrorhizon]
MSRHGCRVTGELNDSSFGDPLIYIGLYSAAASVACLVFMGLDTFHGIHNRKFWFPCKYFPLNASILILIAVATKLSVDLNTSMPRKQDQLVKLTSSAFACTVMANFLPSLGSMENKELLINMVASAIYVVTIQVNICIQLATGVIYMFCMEHVLVLCLMFVMFGILVSSALTIPATKSYFEQKYTRRYQEAMLACRFSNVTCKTKKLRDDLNRFWMMAHTSSPQFVVGRLATCTASGAVCLLNTIVLAEATFRAFFIPGTFQFCKGESDYKWSSTMILIVHSVAIVIGSIAPAFRWLNAINIISPVTVASESWKVHLEVEDYWTRSLTMWKEHPFLLGVRWQFCRKIVHNVKDHLLDVCILVQIMMVFFCKLIRLLSIYLAAFPIIVWRCCCNMFRILCCKLPSNSVHGSHSPSSNSADGSSHGPYVYCPEPTLNNYVLHLKGEKNLNNVMMRKNFDATNEWIKMGMKRRSEHLEEYLKSLTNKFDGVWYFDSPEIEPIHSPEPPNCWSLPIVTLGCIAVAVSTNESRLHELLRRIKEGLSLVRIVEESLESPEGRLTNIRKAADMVRLGLDFRYKWLDFDLHKLALGGRTKQEVLSELAWMSEKIVRGFLENTQNKDLVESPSKWPNKILAANSMYRISKTLHLMNLDGGNEGVLFKTSAEIIADVMGACLTNLRRVISVQCQKSAIEEREERVLNAIVLFGKTKELLKILDERVLPQCLSQEKLGSIDEWRATCPQETV